MKESMSPPLKWNIAASAAEAELGVPADSRSEEGVSAAAGAPAPPAHLCSSSCLSSASRVCLSAKGVGGVETAAAEAGKEDLLCACAAGTWGGAKVGPSSSGVAGGGRRVRSIRSRLEEEGCGLGGEEEREDLLRAVRSCKRGNILGIYFFPKKECATNVRIPIYSLSVDGDFAK